MDDKWQISYKMDNETLKEAIELDSKAFEVVDTATFNRCKSWINKNSQIYTILKYDNELVGYINFLPLTEECYNKYRAGRAKDSFLDSNEIVTFKKKTNHNCLLLSIVIKKEYRDGEAIKILSNALRKRIEDFEAQGIHISKVVQDCVSVDGIKFVLNFFGAKYVCDSLGGKIYEANLDEKRKIYTPKLRYEEINKDNINVAAKIQYDIFKEANGVGYCDYLEEIKKENRLENKILPINFLVYYNDHPVGVIGLYQIKGHEDEIWLNWLGVVNNYRRKGIGTAMLFHVISLARDYYNKKTFRLFSYETWHLCAISIYKKTMQIQENYLNLDDDLKLTIEGNCKIFSSSLIDKRPEFWNNKFIGLKEEENLHKKSVTALIRDGIIEEEKVKV